MVSIKSLKADIKSMETGASIAREYNRPDDAAEYAAAAADLRERLDIAKSDRRRRLRDRKGFIALARRMDEAIRDEDPADPQSWKDARRSERDNALMQVGRLTIELMDSE